MVKERKWRDDKDRHKLAWNPDYGWQVLRRCPNYIKAVNQFLKVATASGDVTSLGAFEAVSLDEAKFDTPKKKFRPLPIWLHRQDRSKSRLTRLQDQEEALHFPHIANPRFSKYNARPGIRKFEIDTTTNHYRQFFEWFGDILLFPIDPKCVRPRVQALSGLWALYSVKISDSSNLSDYNNDKLFNLSVTINMSFSKTMIEDDLRRIVRSKLTGKPSITEKPRWSKESFNRYLQVMDAIYRDGVKIKISHRQVGEQCAPRGWADKRDPERSKIDWARDARRYVEQKLMPIFDKTPPKRSNKRRY